MLASTNQRNLLEWHAWLTEVAGITLGHDYHWAWHNNNWAIDLHDPSMELLVLLKTNAHELHVVQENNDAPTD